MALGGSVTDISIMDQATEIGLQLARDSSGRLAYREKEMQPFSFMQAAGYVDESSQNPSALYPLAFQKSWVGGFGQAFMRSNEPRRYFASYGVDASEEGVLKCGPQWMAVPWPTAPTTYSLTDGAMETWTDVNNLTNWSKVDVGTGSLTRESTIIHGGTYSARLIANDAGANDIEIMQTVKNDLATVSSDMRGKLFIASVWYRQNVASGVQIKIFDDIGISTTTSGATLNSWVQMFVSRVLSSTATELTVQVYAGAAAGVTAYVDDVELVGYIRANANYYAEYNGLQYMSVGDILYKANSATAPTSWTFVYNFGFNITALYAGQVSGEAYLFIMIGSGNNSAAGGWYYNGTTLTQMTDAGGTDASGDYMTTASTTFYISGRPTGVATGGKYVIRTNTAPLAGAWSSDTNVGDPNTNITGLSNVNNVVYIAKEDSLWKVNTDGTVSMIVDYKLLYAATSGVGIAGWNGKVYLPVGVNSLLEYDPSNGTYSNISPAATASSVTQAQLAMGGAILSAIQTDFDGRIMAVAGGNEQLWALQDNGSVNNLFKGQYSNIDGAGWHWHPAANTTMAGVNAMAMSSLTGSPIIWVGHGTGDPGYYNLSLSTITDPTYTNPMLITPYYTGGVWRMMKTLYSIILGLESITSTVYVTLQYRFYGTTAWSTPVLTFDGNSGIVSNGQDSNFMPANSFGTAIQFRINFISNSTASTAKVTRINGEGVIKPGEVSVIECTVVLQDNQLTRTGTRDTMPASRKRAGLNAIRASNWPVIFYDIEGNTLTVDLVTREDAAAPERRFTGNSRYTKNLLLKKVILA